MAAKIQDLPRDRDAEGTATRVAGASAASAENTKSTNLMHRVRNVVLSVLIITIVAGAADAYWRYASRHPSTDNAYVQANVLQIVSPTNGAVSDVSVKEYAQVKSGDVLLRIDDRPVVKAPAAGIIGKISVGEGSMVKTGMSVFSLVDTSKWWIEANFKETDLAHIEPGQKATILLDLYPAHEFKGVVEAVSPASVASSSLFPPENATGSWVKVTQRFPVRISLTPESGDPDLRVGASATVTIDTTSDVTSGKK